MAPPKKITGYVKLQIEAGKATPAPPVGPALGQAQVNIMEFCKQFNARTSNKEMEGLVIPVVISVYASTAASASSPRRRRPRFCCRQGRGHPQGLRHAQQGKDRQGHGKQVREIATQKMPDLNAASVETAIKSIKGTARSMGIEVVA